MAEQLSFDLTANTKPMVESAAQGIDLIKQKFIHFRGEVDKTFQKPLQMKLELDAAQAAADMAKLDKAQKQFALEAKKTKKSAQLQARFGKNVKVSAQQLLKSRDAMRKLAQKTKEGSQAGQLLADKIKDINNRLMAMKGMNPAGPLGNGVQGLIGKFTLAGTAANLLTSAIMKIAQAPFAFGGLMMEMEQLQLGLQAFTGGFDNAEIAFRRFTDIAAKTPFNLEQVASAGKTMMAFGMDVESSIVATERLGIVAGATGGDLNLMARNLGQIAAQGQAYTRDLTQFAIQGIPIWEEMSKITGKSVSELKKMAADGQISFGLVSQAITNMTAEGTAFADVAERMQDTFKGKMAAIEAQVQAMALGIVTAINSLDEATGGIIKGSLDLLKNTLEGIAENANEVVAAIIAIGVGIAALKMAAFVGTLIKLAQTGRLLSRVFRAWAITVKAVGVAKSFLLGLTGPAGWAAIAAGAIAAGAAYTMLKGKMDEATEAARERANAEKEAMKESQAASATLGMTYDELKERTKGAIDSTIDLLQQNEEKLVEVQQQVAGLKEKYAGLKAAAEKAFEGRKAAMEASIEQSNKVIESLEKQKKALDRLGPAGRRLAEIKKKELEYTAKTGRQLRKQISDREMAKLQAQAQLEDMKKQSRQAEIQKQIDAEKLILAEKQKEMQRATKKHQKDMKKLATEQKEEAQKLNTVIGELSSSIKTLADEIKAAMKDGFSKGQEDAEKVGINARNSIKPTNDLAKAADGVATNFGKANSQLETMRSKILSMPKLPSGPRNAFAGGPVSGGETRTVNELGKEAFLSASGRLSMINAPAWGEWTAPSKGTIIPAHLTKQLDIPTGGINLNGSPSSNAARAAGAGRVGRVVRAGGGDVFNQSVTVQAANPVQAANNMMVEMTRLKRRRFR